MATQLMPSATERWNIDRSSEPLQAAPRRVEELKDGPRKRLKVRTRRCHIPRWREKVVSDMDHGESFDTHITILKILRRIPELRDHVPQLVSNNSAARTYTVNYPHRDLIPFEKEARYIHLSYRKIQGIKSQLYQSVKIMYNNGVRYNIYPQHLFLYTPISWDVTRQLFLGSVTSSDLLGTGQLDWKEQRENVGAQIDRIFAPLEIWAFQEEAADLAVQAREEMALATSIINDKNAAIDRAKADLTEAQAIMAEAYQVIKNARAAMDGVEAVSKEIYTSVIRPQGAWGRAHLGKEYAEISFKRMHVLNDKANTLIQKYGNPKPHNGMDTGGDISHPESRSEESMEMNSGSFSSLSADDAKVVGGSIIHDGASTDQVNSREDGRFGT